MASKDKRPRQSPKPRQRMENTSPPQTSRPPEEIDALSSEEMRRMLHELQARQAELEKQNEELRTAKDSLRESEERYRLLVDSADDIVLMHDADGRRLYISPSYYRVTGWTPEDLQTTPWQKRVHPEDLLLLEQTHAANLRGETTCVEHRILRKDGSWIWVENRCRPITDAQGKVQILMQWSRDITERKKTEETLRQSEIRFRALIEHAPDGVVLVNAQDVMTFASPSARRMFGIGMEDSLASLNPREFTHPEDLPRVLEVLGDLLRDPSQAKTIQYRFRHMNGQWIWIESTFTNLMGLPGVDAFVVNFRNIADRKRAEEALQAERTQLRTLIDTLPDAVYFKNLESRFVVANQTVANIVKLASPEMLIGRTDADFIGPEWASQYRAEEVQVMQEGKGIYGREDRVPLPDGGIRWESITKIPLRDESGNVIGLVGVNRDITDRKRAQEALQKSETLNRRLVEHLPHRVFVKDRNLVYVSCNANYARDLGGTPDQVVGKDDFAFHAADLADTFRADDRSVMETGKIKEIEERFFASGQERWAHTVKVPYRNERGEITGVLGVYEDITDRKRAEAALRESEATLRAFFDSPGLLRGVIEVVDDDILHISDNEVSAKFFGRTVEAMRRKRASEMGVPPDTIRTWIARYKESRLTGLPVCFEYAHGQGKDDRQFRVNVSYLGQGQSGPRHAYAIEDITEHKRVQAALLAKEQEYRVLVENLSAGIVVHASDTSIVFSNPMAAKLLGLTEDQMQGKTALDPAWCFTRDDGAAMPLAEYPVNRVLSSGEPIRSQVIGINHPDAESTWVLCNAYPVRDAGGCITQVVVTFVDITDRKRAEAEKEKLEDQLRQAQKMESVGRLAGGVAHDFNNMLGVILGHVELAMAKMDPQLPLHASLTEVRKAAQRSADLTRQLLAFARKQTVAPKVLDLNEAVEGSLKMLKRLIGENVNLNWQPAHALWPIRMDPSQFDQILTNLCVNASHAITDVGRITIATGNCSFTQADCAHHAGFAPGQYVRLSVSDTGCGMDKETLAHIFEPFFTTKGIGKGTGLGLATVYGAVRQNSGFIDVYSEPGQGTTFKIYLPHHTSKTAHAGAEDAPRPLAPGEETILLVEDEPSILKMATMMLQSMGYKVVAANTPGEAIRLAQEHAGEIHLLMTDVVMPEMNGRSLAQNLLRLYPDIKRLFMSGYTADVIAHHGVLDDGVYFIQKPFSVNELSLKVREALDQK